MPVPESLRDVMPKVSPAALQPQPHARRPEPEIVQHRRDPRKDAREFPAYAPIDHGAQHAQRAAAWGLPVPAAAKAPPAWWEDPVALGSLLILLPPVGLAAVWSSKRYSSDARWALTVMTALMMCLMTAVLIAAIALR